MKGALRIALTHLIALASLTTPSPGWADFSTWSTTAEIGRDGFGEATADETSRTLSVRASQVNPDIATRFTGGGRVTIMKSIAQLEITDNVVPGGLYDFEGTVWIRSASATVDRIDAPYIHPLFNEAVIPGPGAASWVSLLVEMETLNCYGTFCQRGGGHAIVPNLACSDPKDHWWTGCESRTLVQWSSIGTPLDTDANATRSILRVTITLKAVASLGDWRGQRADASGVVELGSVTARAA